MCKYSLITVAAVFRTYPSRRIGNDDGSGGRCLLQYLPKSLTYGKEDDNSCTRARSERFICRFQPLPIDDPSPPPTVLTNRYQRAKKVYNIIIMRVYVHCIIALYERRKTKTHLQLPSLQTCCTPRGLLQQSTMARCARVYLWPSATSSLDSVTVKLLCLLH